MTRLPMQQKKNNHFRKSAHNAAAPASLTTVLSRAASRSPRPVGEGCGHQLTTPPFASNTKKPTPSSDSPPTPQMAPSASAFSAFVSTCLLLCIYLLVDAGLRSWSAEPSSSPSPSPSLPPLAVHVWQALFFTFVGYHVVTAASGVSGADAASTNTVSRRAGARKAAAAAAAAPSTSTPPPSSSSSSSSSPSSPSLPAAARALLADTQARRLPPSSPSSRVLHFTPYVTVLPYPFEAVVHALKHKIRAPNDPLNPTVLEVRTVAEEAFKAGAAHADARVQASLALPGLDKGTPVTLRRREVVSTIREWVPMVMRWAIRGIDTLTIEEDAELFHAQRMLRVTIRNRELQSIGRIQDQGVYFANPADGGGPAAATAAAGGTTVYQSFMDLEGVSTLGTKFIDYMKPKAGEAPPTSEALLASHTRALNARLAEFKGQGGGTTGAAS
jgi:hypothetical protein